MTKLSQIGMTNTKNNSIKKVIIIGGGTAGWISAVALSKVFEKSNLEITLIESDEISTVGVGEATVPHIKFFNDKLGIDEKEFMSRTNATFKLGIEFVNWGKNGDRYLHPFGDYGHTYKGVKFLDYWLRNNENKNPLDVYSLPVMMGEHNKFSFPDKDLKSIGSTFSYAYQFDASLYALYLREISENRGVKRIEGKISNANLNISNGFVESITMQNGDIHSADFFIDCSGFRGLLIEEALKTGYEDWSSLLPVDRAWAVPCEIKDELTPFTRATARDAGWQWRIPLQHRIGNGHVFSSKYMDEDTAKDILLNNLEGKALNDPKLIKFKTGVRKKFWNKNVVAIGLSAGFLEPLESTSIHLIQLAITHLAENWPNLDFDDDDIEDYNKIMSHEFIAVRDFLILHYRATNHKGLPFWDYVKNMEIPDSLKEKMELFSSRGIVKGYQDGFFLEPSWIAVYIGQGIIPKSYDVFADKIDIKELNLYMEKIKQDVETAFNKMPHHNDFLKSYCDYSKVL